MRTWSIISLLAVSGCSVSARVPVRLAVRAQASTRALARVQHHEVIVPVQNAPVAEFFGIPLAGAQDVVFVLDCSGSMSDLATGRMLQLTPNSNAPTAPAGGDPGAQPPPSDPNAPAPAVSDASAAPAETDPNAAPTETDPNAASTAVAEPAPQNRKIDVAQAELIDALRRLPVGTRMNVIFFNTGLEAFSPGMLALEDAAREGLISFVDATEPDGKTALAPALRTAFLMNAQRVVLLSDGLGNVGGDADAVLRDAREAMRGGVRIDTIGLGSGQDASLLQALAGESGGLYQPM